MGRNKWNTFHNRIIIMNRAIGWYVKLSIFDELIFYDEISTFLNFTIRRNLNLRHCSVRLQIFEVAWKYEQQQINNVWYSWSVITNFFDAQCRKYIYRMFKYVFQASSYFSARGDDTIIINTSLDCALSLEEGSMNRIGWEMKAGCLIQKPNIKKKLFRRLENWAWKSLWTPSDSVMDFHAQLKVLLLFNLLLRLRYIERTGDLGKVCDHIIPNH